MRTLGKLCPLSGTALLAFALLCGAASGPAVAAFSVSAKAPCGGGGTPPKVWSHVALIMFENKPLSQIVGNTADAPYINSIVGKCSYSSRTRSLSTTSLANYVALTSGYTGCDRADSAGVCTHEAPITSNRDPNVWPQASKSIFELMNKAVAGSAVEWAEDSQGNCYTGGAGLFTVTHTPYPYYTRTQQTSCTKDARPFPSRPANTLSARFNLIIPNKQHIMHLVPNTTVDDRIRNGDNWLKSFLPQLISSKRYQAGRTVILITWDEGNANDFTVPLIVISPYTTAGGVSSVAYNHYSTLKGIQTMLGQTDLLGHAADASTRSIRSDAVFNLR